MPAYRNRRANRRRAAETDQPPPLDSAQLNAVMRNVFAWMTMGLGVSAMVASLLSAGGLDAFAILTVLTLAVICQLGLAVALYGESQRFSPKQAGVAFFFYSVVMGASASCLYSLLSYPEPSSISVTLCLSLASLCAAMTLIGWKSKLDLSQPGAYFRMGLLGLLIAAAVNTDLVSGLSDGGSGLAVSLIAVILFTGLTAFMTERIARLAADPYTAVDRDDAARFGILAALKLYLSLSMVFLVLPVVWLLRYALRGHGNYGDSNTFFGDGIFGGDDGGFDGFDGGDFGD